MTKKQKMKHQQDKQKAAAAGADIRVKLADVVILVLHGGELKEMRLPTANVPAGVDPHTDAAYMKTLREKIKPLFEKMKPQIADATHLSYYFSGMADQSLGQWVAGMSPAQQNRLGDFAYARHLMTEHGDEFQFALTEDLIVEFIQVEELVPESDGRRCARSMIERLARPWPPGHGGFFNVVNFDRYFRKCLSDTNLRHLAEKYRRGLNSKSRTKHFAKLFW